MPVTAEPLLVSVEGPVATLALNRPHAGNTIDLPLAEALLEAARRCDSDPSVRCVVLTGQGRLFCAGGDIAAMAQAGDRIPEYLAELADKVHRAVLRLMRMRKPLLILANGPAAGAGLSLAISGDVVIAARSAHFTPAYGSVGLSPDGGMTWLLPRLVGMRRAQSMILRNQRVGSEAAEAMGLVSEVVGDDDLARRGALVAAELAASPTLALGAARSLLLDAFDGPLELHLQREAAAIEAVAATKNCREGVSAFLERRKPDFRDLA